MSGDMLSQDEIDALLRGDSVDSNDNESNESDQFNVTDYISEMEQDALGEIGNISFGSSATALSTLLSQKVEITTPKVDIINRDNLEAEFPHPYVAIQVQYTEGFSGMNMLVIKRSDAAIIADLMLGGDGTSPSEAMDEIHLSAVQEAMNQMMGSAATSMSTVFRKKVDISPPTIDLMYLPEGEGAEHLTQELLVKISFRLKIGSLIDSSIMQLLPLHFAKSLVSELVASGEEAEAQPTIEAQPASAGQERREPAAGNRTAPQPQQTPVQVDRYASSPGPAVQADVQPAVFTEFGGGASQEQDSRNLDMLLDIPLQVTVELGRTKRSVKEILEFGAGSIIELDKLAGEPVDILVNNRLIAQGEVVVIDENFGVRITDIMNQSDRLKKIK